MNFRQPPSKFKNQILTAQKRDQFHSELDLIKDTIGNDSTRTVQANHDTIVFSCGNTGVGFVPLNQPGKFGFQHQKITCGHVSDIHISPFVSDRLVAVSCTDQSVRVYRIPKLDEEEEVGAALCEFRASAGTANTPVLVCWNPQVSGILAVGSGTKLDVSSISSGKVDRSIDITSPVVTLDWSHDGSKIIAIGKDSTLRIVDPRELETINMLKVAGTKHVIKSLSENRYIVSFLSKMRERELNLYAMSNPSEIIRSWSFGTASTPLVPIVDTVRKIVYLLDKSGGVLRWIESFAPYNEGAAGTSVDQSSNACLIHPFGLQLMEGEINRMLIADTKGNTVPVRISIGRKSYLEFHDDLYTPIEIESSISAEDWLGGSDSMAKVAKVQPSIVKAAQKDEPLSSFALSPVAGKESNPTNPSTSTKQRDPGPKSEQPEADPSTKQSTTSLSTQPKAASTLSAREQRKWDKEEAAAAKTSVENREAKEKNGSLGRAADSPVTPSHAKQETIDPEVETENEVNLPAPENSASETRPTSEVLDNSEDLELGRGAPPLDDEDALERLRARRVTPAIEKIAEKNAVEIQSPQPQREVFREDLSARRAEYGAPSPIVLREVYKENLGERRAEYGAKTGGKDLNSSISEEPTTKVFNAPATVETGKEVYREDLSSRRSEYGAPSKSTSATISSPKPSMPVLSAREQRIWDKEVEKSSASSSPKVDREVYKEDLSSRRAEYGASPVPRMSSGPPRVSTAEREAFAHDVTSRRAEYGVTPKLDGPTQAYKEITNALGKSDAKTNSKVQAELIPYREDDDLGRAEPTKEQLENAYAPPIEDSLVAEKKTDIPVDKPAALVEKAASPRLEPPRSSEVQTESADTTKSSSDRIDRSAFSKSATFPLTNREYTRKYLEGRPQHPRNSYTTLVGLNASLPNTARMVDATPAFIIFPLAGPGGRLGIIPYERAGRQPPLITGFTGGAQVVDFEADKFQRGRVVSAHADQAVRVWTVPADLDELEADIEKPDTTLTGMDRILSVAFHPYGVKDLLLVTTATKLHLFDVSTAIEIATYPAKGIASATWSLDGSQIAIGKSDKTITILDARSGEEIISFPSVHQSTRLFRLQFVGKDRIISAGFGRASTRQLALYDTANGKELQVHDMDISPSPFSLPYFDEMSSILYLVPRGTSSILPFHIQESGFTPLLPYNAPDPVMGTSFLAPQDLEISKVEVARCLRITTNEITVVGFHIPRPAGDFFHDDIYPTHVRDTYSPSLTAQEWLAGSDVSEHALVPLNPAGLPTSSSNATSATKKAGVGFGRTPTKARASEPKNRSGLEEMFSKAKGEDGDEPENQNDAPNTRWD